MSACARFFFVHAYTYRMTAGKPAMVSEKICNCQEGMGQAAGEQGHMLQLADVWRCAAWALFAARQGRPCLRRLGLQSGPSRSLLVASPLEGRRVAKML